MHHLYGHSEIVKFYVEHRILLFLPPMTASSLPVGHTAGTKSDDCSSYIGHLCLSTLEKPDVLLSSAPVSCESTPLRLHHSLPEDEHNRDVLFPFDFS